MIKYIHDNGSFTNKVYRGSYVDIRKKSVLASVCKNNCYKSTTMWQPYATTTTNKVDVLVFIKHHVRRSYSGVWQIWRQDVLDY